MARNILLHHLQNTDTKKINEHTQIETELRSQYTIPGFLKLWICTF